VDFSKLGVPQKRERLVVIGIRRDLLSEEQKHILEKRISSLSNGTIFSKYPLTPIEAFLGKSLDKLNEEYKKIMEPFLESIKKIDSERKKKYVKNILPSLTFDVKKDYTALNSIKDTDDFENAMNEHDKFLDSLGYKNKAVDDVEFPDGSNNKFKEIKSITDRMSVIPPGENYEFVKGTPYQVKGLMSNIYRRIHPIKPSPTIIAKGGGGTWGYHYSISRQRLTNRERARLQTFPDWFMFEGTPSDVREQIGNAVPPYGIKPFAEELLHIFDQIVKNAD